MSKKNKDNQQAEIQALKVAYNEFLVAKKSNQLYYDAITLKELDKTKKSLISEALELMTHDPNQEKAMLDKFAETETYLNNLLKQSKTNYIKNKLEKGETISEILDQPYKNYSVKYWKNIEIRNFTNISMTTFKLSLRYFWFGGATKQFSGIKDKRTLIELIGRGELPSNALEYRILRKEKYNRGITKYFGYDDVSCGMLFIETENK